MQTQNSKITLARNDELIIIMKRDNIKIDIFKDKIFKLY